MTDQGVDLPPIPAPLPLAVTGVGRMGPKAGSRRQRTVLVVIVALVVVLAAGAWFGVQVVRRVAVPFQQGFTLGSELGKRAAKEYPGYQFAGYSTAKGTTSASDASVVKRVFIKLNDRRHAGFSYMAVYSAPSSVASDPAAYENFDDFFRTGVSPSQPADSFISMWMRAHPKDLCGYVIELGESSDATRTYEVGYSTFASGGTDADLKAAYYEYSPTSGAWHETSAAPAPEVAPVEEPLPYEEESFAGTETAVARALPGFAVSGAAQEPDGRWVAIVRHKKFPRLRMAIGVEYLMPHDENDGMVRLFGGDRTRADAFARAWVARRPHVIIDMIEFDPDYEQQKNLVEVTYSPTMNDVGSFNTGGYLRLRYRPGSHTWVTAK